MVVQTIDELEKILFPYAKSRYDLGKMGFGGKLLKGLDGNLFSNISQRLVQAFCRTLFSIENEMRLNDLTSVVIAEAGHMLGVKPYEFTGKFSLSADFFFQTMGEIHQWFIYLAEQGELPGKYERFLGKYSKK